MLSLSTASTSLVTGASPVFPGFEFHPELYIHSTVHMMCHFIVRTTDLYSFIQIPYRLFESYVDHVASVNIPPKVAASSVISVKLLMDGLWL